MKGQPGQMIRLPIKARKAKGRSWGQKRHVGDMLNITRSSLLLSAAALVVATSPSFADEATKSDKAKSGEIVVAQSGAAPAAEQPPSEKKVERVVVTATKRKTTIQDAPISSERADTEGHRAVRRDQHRRRVAQRRRRVSAKPRAGAEPGFDRAASPPDRSCATSPA